MAVAYGSGFALAEQANATSAVYTAPSGIADGDYLIIWHFAANGSNVDPPTPTPPSGFSALPGGTWPQTAVFGSFNYAQYAWYKKAASESGNYTVSFASTTATRGLIVRVSGADGTTPFAPNNTQNSGTGATTTFTGLTTTAANELVLLFGSDDNDNSNTYTVSGYTLQATTAGECVLTATQVSAGATGNQTMTNNSATGSPWFSGVVAMQAAAGGGGPDLNVYRIN